MNHAAAIDADTRAEWEALHRTLAARRQEISAIYRQWSALEASYGRRHAQYRRDFDAARARPERALREAREALWAFEDAHGLERGWEPAP